MENNTEINKPNPSASNDPSQTLDQIAEKRTIIPIAFIAVVVLFFFSFVNFKCNGSKVASVSGFNLVTGTHIKTPMSGLDDMSNMFNEGGQSENTSKGEKVPSSAWAILAFISAIAGAVVFYKKLKKEETIGFILGVIGAVSLIALNWAVKGAVESKAGNGMVSIEVDFTFAYWLSILLFVAAGGISYLRMKKSKDSNNKSTITVRQSENPV